MMAQMEQMFGGGANPSSGGASAQDDKPPREKYASELQQIKEMGFADEEVIL